MYLRLIAGVTLFLFSLSATAAGIVSPFAGSEPLGEYQTDFVKFHYLAPNGDKLATVVTEGRLISRLYKKPEDKSNYEVFKSYEKELTAAGFEMIAVLDDKSKVELLARDANGKTKNDFLQRAYQHQDKLVGTGTKALVATQAQEYIAARKRIDATDVLVVVSTSRSGNYVIEQLESAAMETGTVTLTLDALRSRMADQGRIAIYGIHFDTGSARIKPGSDGTIATIVQYLEENPGQRFYVVGHTDDQGKLDANMALSRARAEATVDAILMQLPAARDQLSAHGVGPLSPVATNGAADGRALNRRVELVSALP